MNLTIAIPSSVQILIYSHNLPHELFYIQTVNKYLFNLIKNSKIVWKYIKYLPYKYEGHSGFINLVNNKTLLDRGLKHLTNCRIFDIKNDEGFDKLSLVFHNLTALLLNFARGNIFTKEEEQNLCKLLQCKELINNLTDIVIQFTF